jgi:predicted AAA+ superfamily ATPase
MESIVALQNPWKRGQPALTSPILDRRILPKMISWLSAEEIMLIKGARQTGKTTIIASIFPKPMSSGSSGWKNTFRL